MVLETWDEEQEELANRVLEIIQDIEGNEGLGICSRDVLLSEVLPLAGKLGEMARINDVLCTDLDRIDQAVIEDPTREEELRKEFKECLLRAAQGYHVLAECP